MQLDEVIFPNVAQSIINRPDIKTERPLSLNLTEQCVLGKGIILDIMAGHSKLGEFG